MEDQLLLPNLVGLHVERKTNMCVATNVTMNNVISLIILSLFGGLCNLHQMGKLALFNGKWEFCYCYHLLTKVRYGMAQSDNIEPCTSYVAKVDK
jgi:hypothetical protein